MKKILVIDDSDLIREELADIISQDIGAHVSLANSCQQGIQMLKNEEFHFIICDLEMPGENGIVVWNYIQQKDIKSGFVLFTGQSHHVAAQLPHGIQVVYNKNFFKLIDFLKALNL